MGPRDQAEQINESEGTGASPNSFYFRPLLWAAFCLGTTFYFIAIVSAPLTLKAMWGLTGGDSIKIWTIICAICALSLALDYATDEASRRSGSQRTAGDVWAHYVLFLVFLAFMSYFVHLAYTWTK